MHLDGRLPTDWGARHGSPPLRRAEPPTQTIAFVVSFITNDSELFVSKRKPANKTPPTGRRRHRLHYHHLLDRGGLHSTEEEKYAQRWAKDKGGQTMDSTQPFQIERESVSGCIRRA